MGFNGLDLMNGATRAAVEGVDELQELATSILMDGLQEPLILDRVNGEYLLSGGHRRTEAGITWRKF